MIAALDVHYDDKHSRGTGAAVLFHHWNDAVAAAEYTAVVENIQPYVPGKFYRRELPCLVAVISKITEPLDAIVVDGYVRLDDRPGLGQHVFEQLLQKIPVIGVAKTRFHGATAVEILRGGSVAPLFVTAIGIGADEAAEQVKTMHGLHRIPTLLKRIDRLARAGH